METENRSDTTPILTVSPTVSESTSPVSTKSKMLEIAISVIRQLPYTTKGRLILALIAILSSFSLGAYYGVKSSPDYNSQTAAITYLLSHFKVESTKPGVVLSVVAGEIRYTYSHAAHTISKDVADPLSAIRKPLPTHWSLDDFNTAVGLVKAATPPIIATAAAETFLHRALTHVEATLSKAEPYTRPLTGPSKAAFTAAAVVIGGTGGYLGYKITYREDSGLDQEIMLKTLSDPDMWRSSAEIVRTCEAALLIEKSSHLIDETNILLKSLGSSGTEVPIERRKGIREWANRCAGVNEVLAQRA